MPSLMLSALLCAVGTPAVPTVPAWENTIRREDATGLVSAYTSNVIRCEWAGPKDDIGMWMPANLSFQFAVSGDAEATNRVSGVLKDMAEAMNPEVRATLERVRMLCPTLQWLVRKAYAEAKGGDYISCKMHPAAFAEKDFDREKLVDMAKRLRFPDITLPATIRLMNGTEEWAKLERAVPGLDYSDIMPEETFETPFGIGLVVRAPDRYRKFRLAASAFPGIYKGIRYEWRASSGIRIRPWSNNPKLTPELGFAEITVDMYYTKLRFDLMAFACMPDGRCGVPAVFSVYPVPFAHRKSNSAGQLESIQYVLSDRFARYDLAPVWIPRQWTDYYDTDSKGRILSFNRQLPGMLRSQYFTRWGDLVKESYSDGGAPRVVGKVRYFVSPETGELEFAETGEERSCRLNEAETRERGW